MAETYKISLVVEGQDKASGPLHAVNTALGNIGQIVTGILASRAFVWLNQQIFDLGREAIEAVAQMQMLSVSLETLAAAEIISTGRTKDFQEALALAAPVAQGLLGWLRELSLVSPFQYEDVANAYRLFNSFGMVQELAKDTTTATLDFSAAVGLTGYEFRRLGFALAQVASEGRITMLDIRQLANNRFGIQQLSDVFERMSKNTGVAIGDHNEFNKVIREGKVNVDDFFIAFKQYVDETYTGAGERIKKTMEGMRNTLADIRFFALADIFGEAGDVLVEWLYPHLEKVLELVQGGEFLEVGAKIADDLRGMIPYLEMAYNFMLEISKGNFEGGFGLLVSNMRGLIGNDVADELLELFRNIRDTFLETKESADGLTPLLETLKEILLTGLADGLKVLNENWDTFVLGLSIAAGILAGNALLGGLATIAATIAAINWPLLLLVGAVMLLGVAWEENWFGIRDTLTAVWDDTLKPLIDTMPEKFLAVRDFFVNSFGEIQTYLAEVRTAYEESGNIFSKNFLETALQFLPSWVQEFFVALGQAFGDVFAGGGSLFDSLLSSWEQVTAATDTLKEAFAPLLPILETIGAVLGGVILVVLIGVVNSLLSFLVAVISVFGTLLEYVGMFIEGFASLISGVISIVAGILQIVIGLFTGNFDLIRSGAAQMYYGLVDIVRGAFTMIIALIGGAIMTIVTFFWNFYQTAIELWGGVLEAAKNLGLEVPQVFFDLVENIKNMFETTDWPQVGTNLVRGIVDGLKNGAEWLKNTVKELASSALAAAKEALGIKSPSIRMKVEVGEQMALGISAGFVGMAGRVSQAISSASSGLVPRIDMPGYGGFGGLQPAMAPSVNVTINSAINTADNFAVRDVMAPIIRDEWRAMQND